MRFLQIREFAVEIGVTWLQVRSLHFSLSSIYYFLFILTVARGLDTATVINFKYSSSYPVPLTDPQDYYVWDGIELTLSCSYTNDAHTDQDPSLLIGRHSSDVSLRKNLITYGLVADGSTPAVLNCASNWAVACDTAVHGNNDDALEGSLAVTNSYDESEETGQFECRLDLFLDSFSAYVDVSGERATLSQNHSEM